MSNILPVLHFLILQELPVDALLIRQNLCFFALLSSALSIIIFIWNSVHSSTKILLFMLFYLLLLPLLISNSSQSFPPTNATSRTLDTFQINLDLPADQRYSQISIAKAQYIRKFLNYLHTVPKYITSFKFTNMMPEPLLRFYVGDEFYEECQSVAKGVNVSVSEIVVFNYMYELGSYHNFCTSIAVRDNGHYFLGRNLDYGFQEYLIDNSVLLRFMKDGKGLFETVGHAGLIGAHTGLRFDSYAVTLNERIDGGLHLTLKQILLSRSQTIPYLIKKCLIRHSTIQQATTYLQSTATASSAFLIFNSKEQNILIEKKRRGVRGIYHNSTYIVQTNTDIEEKDPDMRRTVALQKMERLEQNRNVNMESVWGILSEKPNRNELTLITVMIDTEHNSIAAKIWE